MCSSDGLFRRRFLHSKLVSTGNCPCPYRSPWCSGPTQRSMASAFQLSGHRLCGLCIPWMALATIWRAMVLRPVDPFFKAWEFSPIVPASSFSRVSRGGEFQAGAFLSYIWPAIWQRPYISLRMPATWSICRNITSEVSRSDGLHFVQKGITARRPSSPASTSIHSSHRR